MTKQELRSKYRLLRNELDPGRMQHEAILVQSNFQELLLPHLQTLLTYSPIISKKEFDNTPIVDHLRNTHEQLKCAWPRIIDGENMEAIVPVLTGAFVINHYGISEPATGSIIDPKSLDCVLVPLLAFDTKGYRVGYGKGYYDRFFQRCRSNVLKIGFSFFEAEEAIDDIDEFDVPLDYCITPLRTYEF